MTAIQTSPGPAALAAQLAEAALASSPLVAAARLANWVGTGRKITGSQVLRPADAVVACEELGFERPPGQLRSAKHVPELTLAWDAALAAGLLRLERGAATVTEEAAALRSGDARSVLRVWVRAARASLGYPEEPCAQCVAALHALYRPGEPVSVTGLAVAMDEVPSYLAYGASWWTADVHLRAPDRGHVEAFVAALTGYGAAELTADTTTIGLTADTATIGLTKLGRVLAARVMTPVAAGVSIQDLLRAVRHMPPRIVLEMAQPWLASRSPAGAVRELLAYASMARGAERATALEFARSAGTDATEAWQDWAQAEGFGAHARRWLTQHGHNVRPGAGDSLWLSIDELSIAMDRSPGTAGSLYNEMQARFRGDLADIIRGTRHPDSARIAAEFGNRSVLADFTDFTDLTGYAGEWRDRDWYPRYDDSPDELEELIWEPEFDPESLDLS